MRLKGTHNLPADPQQIWNLLMDVDVLAKITPGISRLEPLGDNKYTAVSDIKLGPVKGTFKGEMEVADPVEPERFTLLIKQNSKIGNVNATGQIILNPINDKETEVEFSGQAKLSGTLARTGQRVLTGVANSMTNQFFKSLEEEIKTRYPATESTSEPQPEPEPVSPESIRTAIPSTDSINSSVATSVTASVQNSEPQVVKDTVQRDLKTEIGLWQRFINWLSNLFKS